MQDLWASNDFLVSFYCTLVACRPNNGELCGPDNGHTFPLSRHSTTMQMHPHQLNIGDIFLFFSNSLMGLRIQNCRSSFKINPFSAYNFKRWNLFLHEIPAHFEIMKWRFLCDSKIARNVGCRFRGIILTRKLIRSCFYIKCS